MIVLRLGRLPIPASWQLVTYTPYRFTLVIARRTMRSRVWAWHSPDETLAGVVIWRYSVAFTIGHPR